MAIRHAGERIAPAWKFVLSLLGGIRRWTFLPILVVTAPILVLNKGGDALSVCFNTVAVLFLCEIDNLLYAILMPERERARVEVEAMVELGDSEAAALMHSKTAHAAVLVLVVPCAVMAGGGGDGASIQIGFSVPVLTFWLAGATEVVLGATGAGEACKEIGKMTGRWVLGLIGLAVLWMLAH